MKTQHTAFVFARGGSKGLPGKNLQRVEGRTLVARAVQRAKATPTIERVIVSTDDQGIATEALRCGAEVPWMRPSLLCEDDSPEWKSWQHALLSMEDCYGFVPETFISVPPTAPLGAPADVSKCLEEFYRGGWDVVVTVTAAHRHPAFNMVQFDQSGQVHLVLRDRKLVYRRQDTDPVWDMCTVAFVAKSAFVLENSHIFEGQVGAVSVPPERSVDVDSQLDLEFARFLARKSVLPLPPKPNAPHG